MSVGQEDLREKYVIVYQLTIQENQNTKSNFHFSLIPENKEARIYTFPRWDLDSIKAHESLI